MSKPSGSKPRASEPVRLPSNPPPNDRKSSGTANGVRSPSKFYDGPTVPKKAGEVKDQAKVVTERTVSAAKAKSKQAVRLAKRHPYSLFSLISTIPFLLFISLFSTVLCPPPSAQPSGISRFVQSRLGIYEGPSELRQTLCYPSYRYKEAVLEPYVYPTIEKGRLAVEQSRPYTEFIQPGYVAVKGIGEKYWERPIKPVLDQVRKAGKRVYLTQIQPHLPWIRTKYYTLTAPISDRISALHGQYLAPHISTARGYINTATKNAISSYKYAASHPLTHTARRHANTGYKLGSKKGQQAYTWSRPYAIRIGRRAEQVAREEVAPRVIVALKWVVEHVEEAFYIAKVQIARQYNIHLDPHLHPYTTKASAALSPYTSAFIKSIYTPYLSPYIHYFLPASLLTPEKPKSFWTIISDFLPSPGSSAAERKGRMSDSARKQTSSATGDAKAKASSVSAAAKSKISEAEKQAAKSASSAAAKASKSAKSVSRAVKDQASTASSVGKSIVEEATGSVSSTSKSVSASVTSASKAAVSAGRQAVSGVSSAANSASASAVSAVDAASPVAESVAEQVTASIGSATASTSSASQSVASTTGEKGKMTKAEFEAARDAISARLAKQGKASIENLKRELIAVQTRFFDETYPKMSDTNKKELTKDIDYILSGMDKLYSESEALTRQQVMQSGVMAEQRLSNKLATIKARGGEVPRVTKDQGKPALRREMDAVDGVLGKEWTDLAMKIAWIDGITPKDRSKFNELRKSADEYKTRLAALHEGKEMDKSVQGAESKVSVAIKELSTELDDLFAGFRERVKILQKSAFDKIEAREMIRGSKAAAAAAKSSAHTADGSKATILPIIPGAAAAEVPVPAPDDFIGKGREQVIQALSQASSAALGEKTKVASGVKEQVVASASSVYEAAGSAIHDATRSAIIAAGATPSPESPAEHAYSVLDAASRSASSALHHATRSAMSAVGATPSAENLQETVESVYTVASQSAASVVSVAGDSAHDATEAIKSALNNLHSATESLKSAAPSPTINDYLASIANDVAAGAASVYGIVEENVHQATRSVISAAGGTPSPESPMEHVQSFAGEISKTAESLASLASASISSLASAASASASSAAVNAGDKVISAKSAVESVVHEGTRSVIKAVGATPSPESPQEHFEAYAAAAAENLGALLADVQGSAFSLAGAASSAVHSGTRSIIKAAGVTPSPETPGETVESVISAASASASSVYSAAGDQAALLGSSIRSVLGLSQPTPIPTPIASSASAYLASLSSLGVSAGNEALVSGSSILAALQSQVSSGEVVEKVKEVAGQMKEAVVGRDEL